MANSTATPTTKPTPGTRPPTSTPAPFEPKSKGFGTVGSCDPKSKEPASIAATGKPNYHPHKFDIYHLVPDCVYNDGHGDLTVFKTTLNIPLLICLGVGALVLIFLIFKIISMFGGGGGGGSPYPPPGY